MTISPADRPKAIVLIVLIIAFFAFAAFRFLGNKGPQPVAAAPTPSGVVLPSTASIAEGNSGQPKTQLLVENLHESFPGMGEEAPMGNPFRMPVPPVIAGPSTVPANPSGPISMPSAGNPGAPVSMGGQLPVTVNPSDVDSKVKIEGSEVMVKGIIAPMDGSAPLVLLKVGDTTKGYRVGDEIAPGMTLTAISETKISVQIGNSTVKAGVGQAVKPA
jgi:hypothetical protein